MVHGAAAAVEGEAAARASALEFNGSGQVVRRDVRRSEVHLRRPALMLLDRVGDLIAQAQIEGHLGADLPVVLDVPVPVPRAHAGDAGSANGSAAGRAKVEGGQAAAGVGVDGLSSLFAGTGQHGVEAEVGCRVAVVNGGESLPPMAHADREGVIALVPCVRLSSKS